MRCGILFLACVFLLTGCAGLQSRDVVPAELAGEVARDLSLARIQADPEQYNGTAVVLGGKIVRTMNRQQETLIEVVQLPLNSQLRPKDVDASQGRFLVRTSKYLDPYIYGQGREITVVGRIAGTRMMKIGEMDYEYLLLQAENIRLWEPEQESVRVYHDYSPFFYWPGPGWGHPYWR